jgi:hypothetical protein
MSRGVDGCFRDTTDVKVCEDASIKVTYELLLDTFQFNDVTRKRTKRFSMAPRAAIDPSDVAETTLNTEVTPKPKRR